MKRKLEDKIIRKVYRMETQKTFAFVAARIVFFLVSAFLILLFLSTLIDILAEQGSFDLFDFVGPDFEAVTRYLPDNLILFWEETPKTILSILILAIIGFIYLTARVIKNYKMLKNKLVSIYKFYNRKP